MGRELQRGSGRRQVGEEVGSVVARGVSAPPGFSRDRRCSQELQNVATTVWSSKEIQQVNLQKNEFVFVPGGFRGQQLRFVDP